METRVLPVGIQSFETMREQNYLYIDKTAIIYKMVSTYIPYFLNRPQCFGKKILLSTIKAYFEGRKDLFKGLAIETMEDNWTVYPVLYFDLSILKTSKDIRLCGLLDSIFEGYESTYGISNNVKSYAIRLSNLIRKAYESTNEKVVVLINEYDAPVSSAENEEYKIKNRNVIRNLFSPLKAQSDYIRFLCVTGISKFCPLNIFSGLNNLYNISLNDEFSSVCGFTAKELHSYLKFEIEKLAKANAESYEQAFEHLRLKYGGYHFSSNGEETFNPYSLFHALINKKYDNYWFHSGSPLRILKNLNLRNVEIDVIKRMTSPQIFDSPSEFDFEPLAELYHKGYLTISGYDKFFHLYNLDYPNEEVRSGFLQMN